MQSLRRLQLTGPPTSKVSWSTKSLKRATGEPGRRGRCLRIGVSLTSRLTRCETCDALFSSPPPKTYSWNQGGTVNRCRRAWIVDGCGRVLTQVRVWSSGFFSSSGFDLVSLATCSPLSWTSPRCSTYESDRGSTSWRWLARSRGKAVYMSQVTAVTAFCFHGIWSMEGPFCSSKFLYSNQDANLPMSNP